MSASSAASWSLTRTNGSIALCAALAALGGIYYIVDTHFAEPEPEHEPEPQPGLETAPSTTATTTLSRRNAIYRRRARTVSAAGQAPPEHGPEIQRMEQLADGTAGPAGQRGDAETLVDDSEYQDDYSWAEDSQEYRRTGQNIVQLLFRVSEDATRRNAYVHRGCACNSCGVVPIRGIRYRCANCADFDLCETCETMEPHTKTHIFYKIKVPAPSFGPKHMLPVWYSGNPDNPALQHALNKDMIVKLSRETGFERPELDAYWEQWTFMANTEWREDPDHLFLAMDRRTFERSLIPSGARYSQPSLIFDRMFAFYDTNRDELIGFSEFLHGLSYRKKKDRWKRIFDAYDIDADGYVSRKDFLRIFRSYYVLYKQMHREMVEGMDAQQMSTVPAHDLVSGRQPLSSFFQFDQRFEASRNLRAGEGKAMVPNGDLQVNDGKSIVTESGDDTANREEFVANIRPWDSMQPTSNPLNRGYWEAMLDPPSSVEQMPQVLRNLQRYNVNERHSLNGPAATIAANARRHGMPNPFDGANNPVEPRDSGTTGEPWPPPSPPITDDDVRAVEGAGICVAQVPPSLRSAVVDHAAIARHRTVGELNDRWQRRCFYTDEEEGATAPAGWIDQDDILAAVTAESSKAAASRPSRHSRSSSKVRFAEDVDDAETRSNHSNSSRSIPERWGGMEIQTAEKDAGKEILYQVTQQAFNELLDTLFKEKESKAFKAAESKKDRDKYRHLFSTPEFEKAARLIEEERNQLKVLKKSSSVQARFVETERVEERVEECVGERSLEELLESGGYSIEAEPSQPLYPQTDYAEYDPNDWLPLGDIDIQPRRIASNDNSIIRPEQRSRPAILSQEDFPINSPTPPAQDSPPRDPTMPQFRPDTEISHPTPASPSPASEAEENKDIPVEERPPPNYLFELWRKEKFENEAKERGGWGRLNCDEFLALIKEELPADEPKVARLDYLGSWIEFCIPH